MRAATEVKRWVWGAGAWAALTSTAPYVDLEGGIRAQKTTALCAKVLALCLEFPGIHCSLWRWTEDGLDLQLKPKWRAHAEENGVPLQWHADEAYDALPNGSIVYLRGLKPGEQAARFSKLRGLDLGFAGIDQAEEVPPDYLPEVIGRLSQVGYPRQLWLTPQPVNPGHWIDETFPEDNSRPGYFYVRTNAYENRQNLPEGYIEGLERAYPIGSSQRRTLLEGRRGLATSGRPVYQGLFDRTRHVKPIAMNPELPLYEGWDYGHSHPCVLWVQFTPTGKLAVLGAVMGEHLSLDLFAPVALTYREQWCRKPIEVLSTGDPAGLTENNQGLPGSVADILGALGVGISGCVGGNAPEVRDRSTKAVAGYMNRVALDGQPAFVIADRAIIVAQDKPARPVSFVVDGLEAGYVWDERQFYGPRVNIRRPKKDGFYDHSMNCLEYIVAAFGPGMMSVDDLEAHERQRLVRAQRDADAVTGLSVLGRRIRRG